MNARGLGSVVVCLLLDAALAYAGANGQADAFDRANRHDVIEIRGGLLTVSVDGSLLSTVLDVIARQSGVSIRSHAPIGDTVTANLHDVPVDEGLTRILGARSVVFVYADDVTADHHPRLVEVHVYPNRGLGPGSAPTPSVDQRLSADSAENVASGSGSERAFVRAWRGLQDQPIAERTAWAQRSLSQALAQEQDPSARARAARALGRIGGEEAIAQLAASIATDPDTAVREAAAAGLGRTWSEDAVAPLVQALEDQRFFVREAAAHALGETWSDAAVEALARALSVDSRQSVRENAAEALGKIGNRGAVDVLISALGDAHSTVRESAATALGAIGRREALGALVQTSLTDADLWVRQSAQAAAAKISRAR